MDRTPVAYIRRSAADADNPGDVSRELQEAAVREMAHRDGHNGDVRLFVDWAKSASEEKEAARTEFRAMLAEVEAGRASILYAYSLDRLARSTTTFARLLKAAKDHGVRVVTQREGDLSDNGNPTSWAFGFLVSFFAEFELRMSKARAASAQERRRDRGDRFGHAPYGHQHVKGAGGRIERVPDPDEPLEPILTAYRDAGSVLGACRLLESRGIPAPKGGARWATSALTRIIEREAPDLLPRRSQGRRTPSRAVLAQLLKCPFCGAMLTPNSPRQQYYCRHGAHDRDRHPRYVVREVDVLPFVQAEAARLAIPHDRVELDGIESQQAAIAARLERANELYIAGDIDRSRYDAEKAQAARDTAALEAEASVVDLPAAIDWSWPPERVNEVLRELWRVVELDQQMKPVSAEWIVPAWRG